MTSKNRCPICQCNETKLLSCVKDEEYLSSDHVYKYYQCLDCKIIYLFDPPTDKLNIIYPSTYYSYESSSKYQLARKFLENIKFFFDKLLLKKVLFKLKFKTLDCLDVGGGSGWISNALKKIDGRINSTTIIDLNENLRKRAQENGHIFLCENIDDININDKFHFVIMLNLIEHLPDPIKTLTKIYNAMQDKGMLLIKTPNTDTISKYLFKKFYWGGYHAPRHWVLFDKENFFKLAKRCHFSIEYFTYTQGAPQWTTSIIGSYYHIFSSQSKKPIQKHFLSPYLMMFFAIFDYLTLWLIKPSQMIIVLKKN